LPITRRSGPLAQLVEQLTFNQWVAGSNPARLTTDLCNHFSIVCIMRACSGMVAVSCGVMGLCAWR
jgi:hypothetical protein